jgi:hypothetical protein
MTLDIAVNLLAAVIIFLSGVGFARLRRWWELHRPGQKVWRVGRNESVSIVTADGPDPDPTEYTITVYPAEYAAALEIAHYLGGELGCRIERICTSSEFPEDHAIEGNLVLIGGPVHNPLTALMLERLHVPFHFEGYTLVNENSGERYDAVIENEMIVSDVALIVTAPNPYNPSNRVVLIAGCRTYGCVAGARQLINPLVSITAETASTSSFLVVRSDVLKRYVSKGKVLTTGTLQSQA